MTWTRFWRRSRRDRQLATELDCYLQHEIDDNLARGMTPDQARFAAHRKLGNAAVVQEEVYQMNTIRFIDSAWQDLRHSLRLMLRNPGFTAIAVASLALGIGANAAIFQLLNAVRLRTLPVDRPEEVVDLRVEGEGRSGNFRGRNAEFSGPLWDLIRDHQQALAGIAAWGDTSVNLSPRGEVRNVDGLWVSGSFFATLEVRPVLGRFFTPEDDRPGCALNSVVISNSLWQREFAGSPDVLSRTMPLGEAGAPVAVIGVAPPDFFGMEVGRRFDVAMPLCASGENRNDRGFWFVSIVGRLKPGWTLERARAHLAAISPGVFQAAIPPRYDPGLAAQFRALRLNVRSAAGGVSGLRTSFERPLWILLTMVGLILLIACANLANLMLARGTAREQELAIRLSIGASRTRIVRQLLTESLALSAAGAVAGLLLAAVLARSIVAMISTTVDPVVLDLSRDWRVLGFTGALACGACLLFGLAPAISTGRSAAIRATGRGLTAGRSKLSMRRVLLVTQVALCLVLLSGAMLFVRSFRNLTGANPGFEPGGILVANSFFRAATHPPDRRYQTYKRLLERLRNIPGVEGVATGYVTPIGGSTWDREVKVDANTGPAWLNAVSPEYFRVMRIPLAAGREFHDRDTLTAPKVAVVNEAFARRYFGGRNPVGLTFRMPNGGPADTVFQIVGLARNAKYRSVREDFPPVAYLAASQEEQPRTTVRFLLRSAAPRENLTAAVKRILAETDPDIAVRFAVLKNVIEDSLIRERLMAMLSGMFAVLAAVLATLGLYGVVSYLVARRRGEIGIRMALGATRGAVVRMIVAEVVVLLAVGLTIGAVVARFAGRWTESLLYGLQPADPLTFTAAILILGAAGMLAGWIPALRASTADPMTTLREQ